GGRPRGGVVAPGGRGGRGSGGGVRGGGVRREPRRGAPRRAPCGRRACGRVPGAPRRLRPRVSAGTGTSRAAPRPTSARAIRPAHVAVGATGAGSMVLVRADRVHRGGAR